MAVYLYHLWEPLSGHAGHYCGYTPGCVWERYHEHYEGKGARMLQVARLRGHTWSLVKVWEEGDRKLERRLKNSHNLAAYCPVCADEYRRARRNARLRRKRQLPLPLDLLFYLDDVEEMRF